MDSSFQNTIFSVWKPKMITSTDVVRKIKNKFSLAKVGHCGTLDPFAEGVLIIVSGNKTTESEKYMSSIKTYLTTIVLGEKTDTLDNLGSIIQKKTVDKKNLKKDRVRKVLNNFIGIIYQRPPSYSAKKINGVRLYKLARKDVFVHLKPVQIEILKIELISIIGNELSIKVKCHKGTYIRQLGNDIAESLGTVGS